MKKILIVDDIDINRIILRELLLDTYEIDEAIDGMEAITKIFNSLEKPDLILLDIIMPNLNGTEVFKMLRANPYYNKIPVIFITADDNEANHLIRENTDYIKKPFNPDIVRNKVANFL